MINIIEEVKYNVKHLFKKNVKYLLFI